MQRFFPAMFQKPDQGSSTDNTNNIYHKFADLKADLALHRDEAD